MSFDIRVGQTGNFQLLTPFDTTLKTELQYTCIAIRKIKDYILDGIDVYTEIYKKVEISSLIYDDDVKNNSSIIHLQNDLGEVIKIPERYFKDVPISDGVLYNVKILGFSLGPLPKDIDLTYATQKCKDVLLDTLGVNSTPKVVIVSTDKLMSYEEDAIATAAREILIKQSNTERSKIIELENRLATANTKIAALEEYIKNKYIPPDTP